MTNIVFPERFSTVSKRLYSLLNVDNEHAYKNTKPYGSLRQYKTQIDEELNGFSGTIEQHKYHANEVKIKYDNIASQAHKEYNEERAALDAQFRSDLEDWFGVTGHPKADLLFNKAWERGHSGGYIDVYNNYSDLVDLIKY